MPKRKPNNNLDKPFYTIEEVLLLFGCTRDTLNKMMLPWREIYPGSRRKIISKEALEESYLKMPLVGGDFDPTEL